jgi:hypothetical protein
MLHSHQVILSVVHLITVRFSPNDYALSVELNALLMLNCIALMLSIEVSTIVKLGNIFFWLHLIKKFLRVRATLRHLFSPALLPTRYSQP